MSAPLNPVHIVMNWAVWGDVRSGVLVDCTGAQYRFITVEDGIPDGCTLIDYTVLKQEKNLIWISQIDGE